MTIGAVLSSLFAVVIALAAVLGLAWVLLKGLRKWQDRFQGDEEGGERPIRFLRAMPLGQTERVVMVEVRGETMLLGVTAGGISLLARWPEGAPAAITTESLR
ncbi:flagellar biosynthetic protein FliO [Sphingomonas populi]|uniref:Flagellar biosynthetic protein FliO n=1 Tax=Sphingomonas populi TaxID=2484750 RepID=A0A4Q6XWN5_9SPHN|nr:flagellar biosynthetic protein FliO [Sphingomonas populi]RZF65143.1 flagellar biosynthetic protein FliO [Sphingomonas populi]